MATPQKMKFSIMDCFSKCEQLRGLLFTFTKEILKGKLHFLCSGHCDIAPSLRIREFAVLTQLMNSVKIFHPILLQGFQ